MRCRFVLLMLLLALLYSCSTVRKSNEKVFLTSVKLNVDNDSIDYYDLKALIKQRENRKILSLFRFHTGVYNLGAAMKDKTAKKTEKWNNKVAKKRKHNPNYVVNLEKKDKKINSTFRNWLMNTIGEAPVFLDSSLVDVSKKQMLKYCATSGFFDATVDDTIIYRGKYKNKCKVKYVVNAGTPYRLNNIRYVSSDKEVLSLIDADSESSLLKKRSIFNEETLDDERTRINDLLKCKGYYFFSKSYIRYEADTMVGNNNVDLKVQINRPSYAVKTEKKDSVVFYNHKKFNVKRIFIFPDFQIEKSQSEKYDTTMFFKTRRNRNIVDTIYFVHNGKMKIKPRTISRKLYIGTNRPFNIKGAQKTQTELSNLNNYKYINIRFVAPVITDYSKKNEDMDAVIELSMLPVNSMSFEVEGTNSSGNLGMAGNLVFKNRNLFNGAEALDFNVSGGLELQRSIFDDDEKVVDVLPFNSMEFGTELSLTTPTFLFPINQDRLSQNLRPVTKFSIGYNYQMRPDYERHISQFKFSYQWRESEFRNINVYFPINLVHIAPDSMFAAYIRQFSKTIRYSYEDHFISGLGVVFNFTNQNGSNDRSYSYRKLRFEQSGLSLWTANGFNNANKNEIYKVFDITYAQYLLADMDLRYYCRFDEENMLVLRSFVGIGFPFGNSTILPFEKSYSAGGSNDIRAWKYRSLGPGGYTDSLYYDKTGDISLVLNAEYRFPVTSWLKGALFVDAGNVWLKNNSYEYPDGEFKFKTFYKQVVVGGGLGIRFDFDFLIFRLDAGFPLYNPNAADGSQWLGMKKIVKRSNFNFGIGYPF